MVEIDFQREAIENGAALYSVAGVMGSTKPYLIVVDEIGLNEDVPSREIVLNFAIVVSFDEGEIVIGERYLQGLEAVDGSSE